MKNNELELELKKLATKIKEITPANMIITETTVAKIGLLIKNFENISIFLIY